MADKVIDHGQIDRDMEQARQLGISEEIIQEVRECREAGLDLIEPSPDLGERIMERIIQDHPEYGDKINSNPTRKLDPGFLRQHNIHPDDEG